MAYVEGRVCPECGSRVKVNKKAGLLYCTSRSCTWMQEIVGW